MADLVEEMVCHVAQSVLGTLKIEHRNAAGEVTKTINLQRPWRRVRMTDLVQEWTGWRFDRRPLNEADPDFFDRLGRESMKNYGGATEQPKQRLDIFEIDIVEYIPTLRKKLVGKSPAEQLVEVYESLIEPHLLDPTFVTHVPSVAIPLAREDREDPFFADVYELAINGQEISPGYSELNDPDVQAKHFAHQVGDKEEQQKVDDDFLNALRYGMPPAGGMGLGIDRLVMMLTGAESIRDIILFPLMRPVE
jgi:lysyl-tRNA synthetase class 2